MKRFSILAVLALLVFSGFSCKKQEEEKIIEQDEERVLTSVLFYEVPTSGLADNFYEIEIALMPDYKKRILNAEFSKKFPNRSDDDLSNIQTEGEIGAEQFEKFEEMVDFFDRGAMKKDDEVLVNGRPVIVGRSTITIIYNEDEGTADSYTFFWTDEVEGLDEVKSFYDELVAIFTEDI